MRLSLARGAGLALALLLTAATTAPAVAQLSTSARGLGMAGAHMGLARGQEALLLNPANLALSGNPAWSLAMPQVAVGGAALGLRPTELPDLLGTGELTQAERDALLASVPRSGAELGLDVKLPAITLQNGRFALGAAYATAGDYRVGYDLLDLAVNGYEEGRFDYRVGDTGGERASYIDVAAGYGRSYGSLSLGVTGHYYRGLTLTRSRLFGPTYDLEARDIRLEYAGVYAGGGNGWGVDIGAALQPSPRVTLSAAVSNALSSMHWGEDLTTRRIDVTRDQLQMSYTGARGFTRRYSKSEEALDGSAPAHIAALAEGLTDGVEFPALLRTGVGWTPWAHTQIGAGYERQLTDGHLGGGWEQVASVGVEQGLSVLRFRAGLATDLDRSSLLSGGLSLGPLHLGVARLVDAAQQDRPVAGEREGWIATFGLSTSEPVARRR